MPSPLGHALAGAAAGWALTIPSKQPAALSGVWRTGAWFAALGALPDLDLALGAHRAISHSIGAAVIVGLAAGALTRSGRVALASIAAYASHALLDWLAADSSPPLGVMALWPFTTNYYLSGVEMFDSIWRKKETPDFWPHNLKAIARELLILLPPALIAYYYYHRRRPAEGLLQQARQGDRTFLSHRRSSDQ